MSYHKLDTPLDRESFQYPITDSSTSNGYAMNFLNYSDAYQPNVSQFQNPMQYQSVISSTNHYGLTNTLPERNHGQVTKTDDDLFTMVNRQYTNQLMCPMTSTASNAPEIDDVKPSLNTFEMEVRNKIYPKELYKRQKRLKGVSEQRIDNGCLELILNLYDSITFHAVKSIQVHVKRTNEVPGTHKYIGPVPLEPSFQVLSQTEYLLKVDLDSVYETRDGKKVYELQKTLTNELNLFHLIITVTLKDGRQNIKKTDGILLIGKKGGVKRSSEDAPKDRKESSSSVESLAHSSKKSPSSGYVSPTSPDSKDEDILKAQTIVADHIETKSMEIGGILVGNKIVSPKGDIAYHFAINEGDSFEEGEVVGFQTNVTEDHPKIIKLTASNADQVVLKGVVTRSQYFEAKKPKDSTVKTETICMMGIVPVRINGSVDVYDELYASPSTPGFATSGQHLNSREKQSTALIGYAFQSLRMLDESETGMVQAGVSVLNSASQVLLSKRLREITDHWGSELSKMKRSNKRVKKWSCIIGISLAILLSLTGIFLWQLLVPGSAYRYYRCRLNSMKGRSAQYQYPGPYNFTYPIVNGIEFEFDKLMEKTDHSYNRMNDTVEPIHALSLVGNVVYEILLVYGKCGGARYYLNIDLCAYGNERNSIDDTTGMKKVHGPELFAVDHRCFLAYRYFEAIHSWYRIESVSWELHKNIDCTPETEYKHLELRPGRVHRLNKHGRKTKKRWRN